MVFTVYGPTVSHVLVGTVVEMKAGGIVSSVPSTLTSSMYQPG
jgi:hypothetical protein